MNEQYELQAVRLDTGDLDNMNWMAGHGFDKFVIGLDTRYVTKGIAHADFISGKMDLHVGAIPVRVSILDNLNVSVRVDGESVHDQDFPSVDSLPTDWKMYALYALREYMNTAELEDVSDE